MINLSIDLTSFLKGPYPSLPSSVSPPRSSPLSASVAPPAALACWLTTRPSYLFAIVAPKKRVCQTGCIYLSGQLARWERCHSVWPPLHLVELMREVAAGMMEEAITQEQSVFVSQQLDSSVRDVITKQSQQRQCCR